MASNTDQRIKRYSSSGYQNLNESVSVIGSTRVCSNGSNSSFSFRFRYFLTYLSVVLLLHNYTFLICDASLTTLAPSTKPAHVVASSGHHKPTESPFIAAAEAAVAAAFGVLSGTSPHPTTTASSSSSSPSPQSHSHIEKSSQPQHQHSATTLKPVIIEISSSSTKEKKAPSSSSHSSSTSSPSSSSKNKLSEAQTSLIDDIVAELQDKQVQEIANELVKDGEKVDTIKLVSSTTSLLMSTVKPTSQQSVATTAYPTTATTTTTTTTTTTGKLKSEGELSILSPLESDKKVLQPAVLANLKVVETTTKHPNLIHLNNAPLISIEPQKQQQQQQQQQHIQIRPVAPALTPVINPVLATPNVAPIVSISSNHNTTVVTPQSVPLAPIQQHPPANLAVQTATPNGANQTSVNIAQPASGSLAPAETNKSVVNVVLNPPTNEASLNGPSNVQVNVPVPAPNLVPIPAPVSNPVLVPLPSNQQNATVIQQNATQITVSTPTTVATPQTPNNTIQVSIGNPQTPPVLPATIPSPVPAPVVQIEAPPVAGNITPILAVPTVAQHEQPSPIKSTESVSVIDLNQPTVTHTNVTTTTIDSNIIVQTTIAPLLTLNSNNNLTAQPPVATVLVNSIEAPKVTPAPTVVSLEGAGNTVVSINQSSAHSPSTIAPIVGLTIQPIATVAPIVSNVNLPPPSSVAPLAQLITGSTGTITEANGTKILAPAAPALVVGSSPSLAVAPESSTNIKVVQTPILGNQPPTNITVTTPLVTANTTSFAPTPLLVQQTTIVEPTTIKPHVDISLNLAAKNITTPAISVTPSTNINQTTAEKTNTSIKIDGKSNVTVVEKVIVATTTTKKPIKKKGKSSLNSLDNKLKKLKSRFAAANIHDVIVIGDHEEGDDMLEDYDEHGEHHNDDHDKAGGHKHHDKELKLDHDIVEVEESVSSAPSKTTAEPSRVKVIEVSSKDDAKTKTEKKEKAAEDKEEEGEIENHEDHEHLLKGLSRGDVIHVDVGDLE